MSRRIQLTPPIVKQIVAGIRAGAYPHVAAEAAGVPAATFADWLQRGMHYTRDDIFLGPEVRPGMILAWLCGFALYEWLAQTQGLGFWTDFLARLHPLHSQVGASLPSFALSFALASIVCVFARRGVVASAEA